MVYAITMVEPKPSTSEKVFFAANASEELTTVVKQTNVRSRVTTRKSFQGAGGTVVPNSGNVVVEFGTQGDFLDLSSAKLRFQNLTASATAGAVRFQNFAPALIINQVIVYAGGSRVASLQHVGLWCLTQHYLRGAPYSVNQEVMGFGTRAQRDTWSSQNRAYELPLSYILPGVSSYDQRYGALRIEFTFANATFPLESTAGGVTGNTWSFNSSTSYLQYDILSLKLSIPIQPLVWRAYKVASQTAAAGATAIDIPLAHRLHNLLGLVSIEQITANTALTNLDRAETFALNGRTGHQALIDSSYVPPYRILYNAVDYYEGYTEMLRQAPGGTFPSGAHPDLGAMESMSLITPGTWGAFDPVPSKSVITINFARSDTQGAPGVLSGANTTQAGSDTRLITESAAGLTAASTYTVFVVYQSVIRPVGGAFILEE